MNPNKNNGRVDMLSDKNYDIYGLFKESKKDYRGFGQEAIKNVHNNNPLSDVFFSNKNVDALQDAIINIIYERSCKKYSISRQSDTELRIVMRSVYLEHGRHSQYNTIEEVKRLNGIVLQYCVPRIMQEINIYMQYKTDVDKIPDPMDRGEFVSAKGTKTLITKEF